MLRSIQGMRMALKRLEQQKAAAGASVPAPPTGAAHAAPDSTVLGKHAALQAQMELLRHAIEQKNLELQRMPKLGAAPPSAGAGVELESIQVC
ncbi:transcriptional regulator [Chlorella sorokiniana]|uniref:Transcriptional regulator n=1 Tax=Chlorella sorokiniana TaxID=3076 RepID=A0A2P6TDN8_CHLSO|nr:transcriptional regulator [Chlorella sorokiniana]|eukprot:PRW20760.1 transcriptional regulator [Chlorella sorokiniana]